MKNGLTRLLSGLLTISPFSTGIASDKQTGGWSEYIRIFPGSMMIKPKFDTGADNSSLNAEGVEYFTESMYDCVKKSGLMMSYAACISSKYLRVISCSNRARFLAGTGTRSIRLYASGSVIWI